MIDSSSNCNTMFKSVIDAFFLIFIGIYDPRIDWSIIQNKKYYVGSNYCTNPMLDLQVPSKYSKHQDSII